MALYSHSTAATAFASLFSKGKRVVLSILMVALVGIIPTGCMSSYNTGEKYYQDGRHKPVVVLLPVADHTDHPYGWDASSHLTQLFQNTVESETSFHIPPREHIKQLIGRVNTKELFTSPETVAKQFYPGHDYLVAMELLEERVELPSTNPDEKPLIGTSKGVIHLAGRVLVVSFYQGNVRVILQEMVTVKQPIHIMEDSFDYGKVTPEDPRFIKSPLEHGYKRLVKEITHRVQHYVGLERGNG